MRWRPGGLLTRFLLFLTAVFLALAVPAVGYLIHVGLHIDEEALAARFGNQAARAAAALARHAPGADPQLAADLMAPLAADRAFVCAELRDATGAVAAAMPPAQGCAAAPRNGSEIVLPVGADDGSVLAVRFSGAELEESEHRQVLLAVLTIAVAYLIAVLAAVAAFRAIVGRPLGLLRASLLRSAKTGRREPVGLRRNDELGAVIRAFDEMVRREDERELALTRSNLRLLRSEETLKRLNQELEARVHERTLALAVETRRAEAANRAKSEFLAAVSHELRTPLNSIIGFSEVMKNQTLGARGIERYGEYAANIHESGQHLLALINDILDLSKVEAGLDELHEEDVAVAALVDSVVALVRQRAEYGGLTLALELPDRPPLLRADTRKLKQILVNLVGNATKFTDPGGTITIGAGFRPDGGVTFRIADTGIGMAPADIPKALAQFGQVDGNLDRRYEGTGLGLPLSRALTELHGGRLEVESAPGTGTTVSVHLPATRTLIARAATAAAPGPAAQPAASGGGRSS